MEEDGVVTPNDRDSTVEFMAYRTLNNDKMDKLTDDIESATMIDINMIENPFVCPIDCEKIMNWKNFTRIYSILNAYGGPTCFLPTNTYLVIGTTKGVILIFDYREFLQSILVPQLINDVKETHDLNNLSNLRSNVTNVVISLDGTHLAASYETGDVFVWDLNLSNNNSDTDSSVINPLYAILNIDDHVGSTINGIAFKDKRHTGLIVSDFSGNISFHNGHRSKLWSLTYNTKKLLTVPSNEILFRMSLEPHDAKYYKNNKNEDILAILTNKVFCILSTGNHNNNNNNKNNNFDEPISNSSILYNDQTVTLCSNDTTTSNSIVPNNDIAFFKEPTSVSNITYIAYSIKNTVIVFVFRIISGKFQLIQRKIQWNCAEPILSLNWISKTLLLILTISHQMIVVDPYDEFNIVMKLDLLIHNLLIPPNNYFKFYHKRLLLLTHYSFKIGKFNYWSTLTLQKVQKGDYIGALIQLDEFSKPEFSIPALLNLEIDIQARKEQLNDPFINLTFAALKYILKKNSSDIHDSLTQLLRFAIKIQAQWFPGVERNIIKFLDLAWESIIAFDDEIKDTFISTIRELIRANVLNIVPPSIFQEIIKQLTRKKSKESKEANSILLEMQKLLFSINPSCWDVDLLVRTLQKPLDQVDYSNGGSSQILLPYIWNIKFKDFLTPFVDLIYWIRDGNTTNCEIFSIHDNTNKEVTPRFIYDYLTHIFLGRYYPSGELIEFDQINSIKERISFVLFNGVIINWPLNSTDKLHLVKNIENESSFPYFNLLLKYDTSRFLSMLNEIIEDPFLNENEDEELEEQQHTLRINRQYIVDILIDIIKEDMGEKSDRKLLIAIFLSLNIPKYPQFIHISNKCTDIIVQNILNYRHSRKDNRAELALESLLPYYEPPDPESFILKLKENSYLNVLMKYYKMSKRFYDMFKICLSDIDIAEDWATDLLNSTIKNILQYDLKHQNPPEYFRFLDLFKKSFCKILDILGSKKTANFINELDPSLHSSILEIGSDPELEQTQQQYLNILYDGKVLTNMEDTALTKKYIELSCKYKGLNELHLWLRKLNFKTLEVSIINDFKEKLSNKKDYEGLSIVYFNQHNYEQTVRNLVTCIEIWFTDNNKDKKQDKLMELVDATVSASNLSSNFETRQKCWVDLLSCLVKQYSMVPEDNEDMNDDKTRINEVIQHVFVKLAFSENEKLDDSTNAIVNRNETKFWKILAGVLEKQDIILMKMSDISDLLHQIFTTYHLEEQISELILKILEHSSSEIVDRYQKSLDQGWSILNNECEICGKRLWGIGLEQKIIRIWEARKKEQKIPRTEVINGKIVLFKCEHGFHTKCLENLGQVTKMYTCLTCHNDSKN